MDMDNGAIGWLYKTAKRNYWRVSYWYEFDDLIQDGYMHYWRVRRKYPDITKRAHIMRLFQITYINHIHDLSTKRTRTIEVLLDDSQWQYMESKTDHDLNTIQIMLTQAPPLIRRVLALLTTEEGCSALRCNYSFIGVRRETTNERLCRLIGEPAGIDVRGIFESYFAAG